MKSKIIFAVLLLVFAALTAIITVDVIHSAPIANDLAAETEAEAVIIAAEAQTKANELLSASLTESLLTQTYYEKRNGVLPTVIGSDNANLLIGVN